MLRMMAVIAVFCGCVGAGLMACARLRGRAELLNALRADIRRLTLLMGYSAEPLARLTQRIADGRTKIFWRTFADQLEGARDVPSAWEAALEQSNREDPAFCALQEQDRIILRDYAAGLGISGQKTQVQNARLLEERFAALAEEARTEYARKGRVYRTIGVLCGAAAAILVL